MAEKKIRPEDAAVAYSRDDLDAIGKVREMTPTVTGLAKELGVPVREEVNARGHREVVATLDRDGLRAVAEAMRPAWRADTRRQQGLESRRPMVRLRDREGREKKVWTAVAETTARALNLHERPHYGGLPVRRGENGQLERYWRGEWEPTGKVTLTTPWPWQEGGS